MADKKEFLIYITSRLASGGFSLAISGLKAVGSAARSAIDHLRQLASRAAVGGIALVTAGIWQLVSALKAFATQEVSEVALASALRQMGVYTEQYRVRLMELASELQRTTKIGDEVWLKLFAQLTRFGMNAENVDRVSDALVNLAGLMDGNVQGATLALQRALEGEFSMFSRYGIKLETTGDKVRDLNNLFQLLADKGGGAMEARARTLQGAWDGMVAAFGDLKEEIGRTFERATGLRDVFGAITGKLEELRDSASGGGIAAFIEDAVARSRELLDNVASLVDYVRTEGGRGVLDILGAAGSLLKGYAKNAASEALALLAVAIPALGRELGAAIKDAMFGDSLATQARKAAYDQAGEEFGANDQTIATAFGVQTVRDPVRKSPEYQRRLKELEEENLRRLLREQGLSLSGRFASGPGALDIEQGQAQLAGIVAKGEDSRAARRAAEEERRKELERYSGEAAYRTERRNRQLDEARVLYGVQVREQRDAQAGLANAKLHGSKEDVASAQARFDREQEQTREVAALIRAVQQGDFGLGAQMVATLRSVVENNRAVQAQLDQLAAQIRNGRS